MPRRRVFVTGVGLVSPHGEDPDDVFEQIFSGRSAVRRVENANGRRGAVGMLAPVTLDPEAIPKVHGRVMARASKMAFVAAGQALSRSDLGADDPARIAAGVYMGCALGGSETLEHHYGRFHADPPKRPRVTTTPMIMASGPASHVSMRYGITGPTLTYSIACVSSAVALGEAFRAIRDGYLEIAVAGGSEAQLNPGTVAAWHELGVLAKEHESGPEASSRPFDATRTGLVLGEGAAILILEAEDSLSARGVEPLAEVMGYGVCSDAHNLTEPLAEGQATAIRLALDDAQLSPDRIGYVNAHATGTLAGDRVESEAIKQAFGSHASTVAISSTKSMHGHLVGAAGALEAALTIRALQTGRIPPTANLTEADPACDLDYVPLVGRSKPDLEYALSNSFAFGGTNAALVLAKV